ncbi:MAG TPA: formylglycine-generating enzyme family protein, partial [Candidatus Sumerlaeota bacterium]|nr:formylglycine-generating enzyme family protein [Candidatus Sumerlaeota bacterium]
MNRMFFVTFLLMLALFGLPPYGFCIERDVTPTPTPTPQTVTEELIRDYILSRQNLSGEDKDKADANRDSLVDAADLVWLIADFTPTPTPVEIIVMLPDEVPLSLVRIPAGSFQMGSPENERSRLATESPLHTVNIAYDFYMGKTEITQRQWMAVMGSWPGTPPTANNGLGDNYPAYYISWHDAHDFITSLNDHITSTVQTPLSVYLPSEAEWEYACRAGTQTRFFFGDSLDCADEHQDCAAGVLPGNRSDYMWYVGNNDPSGVKPVGTKRPNQFGLHDMSGSVFEWCEDDWHDDYNGAPADGSAWMDSPRSDMRCFRGASVSND